MQGKILQQNTTVGVVGLNTTDMDIPIYASGTYIVSLNNTAGFQGSLMFEE